MNKNKNCLILELTFSYTETSMLRRLKRRRLRDVLQTKGDRDATNWQLICNKPESVTASILQLQAHFSKSLNLPRLNYFDSCGDVAVSEILVWSYQMIIPIHFSPRDYFAMDKWRQKSSAQEQYLYPCYFLNFCSLFIHMDIDLFFCNL